jgi:4-amino-4-deoxy-L-arabinose transferase-like glycosyltransferase
VRSVAVLHAAAAARPSWAARVLVLLVLIAATAAPRLWHLADNPPALNADELGNVAPFLSIARTGRDLDGRLFPLTYHRITRRPPLYGALAAPLVLTVGREALAVRLPAVALGLLGVVLLWPLGERLLQHTWAGAAAAFVMALSPWHLQYSRIGWEPATIIPLLVLGLLLWLRASDRRSQSAAALAGAALALTVYGYKVFEVLAPVWLIVLLACLRSRLGWRASAAAVAAFGLVYLPFIWTSIADPQMHGWARSVFVFSDGVSVSSIGLAVRTYLVHFSPHFLFVAGDSNLRHHVPGAGELFWWTAPFLVLGAVAFVARRDLRDRVVLVAWLAIYPAGAALTTDQPVHASRTLLGLPALCLIAGLGIVTAAEWIRRRPSRFLLGVLAGSVLAVAVVAEGARFAVNQYIEYPRLAWGWWDYGHAQVFRTLRERRQDYRRVCLEMVNWYHLPTYLEYYLSDYPLPVAMTVDQPKLCRQPGTLVAAGVDSARPQDAVVERVVYSPSGEAIYVVYGIRQ